MFFLSIRVHQSPLDLLAILMPLGATSRHPFLGGGRRWLARPLCRLRAAKAVASGCTRNLVPLAITYRTLPRVTFATRRERAGTWVASSVVDTVTSRGTGGRR